MILFKSFGQHTTRKVSGVSAFGSIFLYEKEIKDMHVVIQDWLSGECVNSDNSWKQFSNRLDSNFIIVSPSGNVTLFDDLCSNMKSAFGKKQGLKIWIDNVQLRHETSETLIVTYEEWQQDAQGNVTSRISTATFKKYPNNTIKWLHLHETWLPSQQ